MNRRSVFAATVLAVAAFSCVFAVYHDTSSKVTLVSVEAPNDAELHRLLADDTAQLAAAASALADAEGLMILGTSTGTGSRTAFDEAVVSVRRDLGQPRCPEAEDVMAVLSLADEAEAALTNGDHLLAQQRLMATGRAATALAARLDATSKLARRGSEGRRR